jgi:hypothetical protein
MSQTQGRFNTVAKIEWVREEEIDWLIERSLQGWCQSGVHGGKFQETIPPWWSPLCQSLSLQFLTIPTTTKQVPPTINFFPLIYVTTQSHSSRPSHQLTFLSSAAETSEFLLCLKHPTFNSQSIVWFSVKIFTNKTTITPNPSKSAETLLMSPSC